MYSHPFAFEFHVILMVALSNKDYYLSSVLSLAAVFLHRDEDKKHLGKGFPRQKSPSPTKGEGLEYPYLKQRKCLYGVAGDSAGCSAGCSVTGTTGTTAMESSKVCAPAIAPSDALMDVLDSTMAGELLPNFFETAFN